MFNRTSTSNQPANSSDNTGAIATPGNINKIKTIAVRIAVVAVAGAATLTGGSAHAFYQTFDASQEDPTSVQVVDTTSVVNIVPMPADPHDEAIVRGTVKTVQDNSRSLVISGSYRGDNNEGSEHIVSAIVNDTVIEIGVV